MELIHIPPNKTFGYAFHAIFICCIIDAFIMLLISFGIKILPVEGLNNLIFQVIFSIVFLCCVILYNIVLKSFLPLFFADVKIYKDKITLSGRQNTEDYNFTDATTYDGVFIRNLENKYGKRVKFIFSFFIIGTNNLEILNKLFEDREKRPPFQL